VQGTIGETTSIALTSSAFDLGGWSEMLPVLAAYEPDGRIAFDGTAIELIDGAPSQFGGRLLLQGVGLNVPDAGRVHLRGSIVGEGTSIRARGLKALMNELTVGIEGQVEDPLGEARFEIAVRSIGEAEVNDLLTALTSSPDRVFGPLRLAGDVKGIAFGDRSFFDALEGEIRFSVGENGGGRLRGISLLRTILDQIPLFGEVAQLTRSLRGGRSIDRYLTDRFRIIEGDFVIGKGQLDARKLRLAYDGYEAELSGPIRLRDLSIDMTGDVVLKSDLVSALSGLAGTDLGQREPIRIPLARVTNTLSDPKVVMTGETLAAMPKLLFQATGLDTITLGVGKAIGRILGNGK
jgi:hypothetical protein